MMTQIHQFAIDLSKKMADIETLWKEIEPLPYEAILFGMAEDELPVLYNVSDARSPNTIVWDRIIGQGIRLIKTAIEFIMRFKDQSKYRTEFVVITNNTHDFDKLGEHGLGVWSKTECVAVVPFWDTVAGQVMFALAGWVSGKRETKSPVILFVDGLENIELMSDECQNDLQYILHYGRKKNIYVIGTAKSESRPNLSRWLEWFQAEIFGQEQIEYFEVQEGFKGKKPNMILFWTPETTI